MPVEDRRNAKGEARARGGHRLILVTGPSGAGRSTAVRVLEDIGYEVIDNLPLSLLPRLLETPLDRPLVLGLDVRNRDFSTHAVIEVIDGLLANPVHRVEVLYLDCSPEVLQRRYSETRRRHPLAPAENVVDGIGREFDLLTPIRARADILIDTSEMTPHDLRAEIDRWFSTETDAGLAISVHSFSYKRGLPRGVDMVFDVRFLQNPYWEAGLRDKNGQDTAVRSYVQSDPKFAPFFERVLDLSLFLLPAYTEEGKRHFSIGFGCTGGQHRSVSLAELLSKALAENGWQVSIRHREIERRRREMPAKSGMDA